MSRRRFIAAFTLAELLVSLAVVSVVLTIVVGFVINQKRALEGTELLRGTNETGKDVLLELERRVRNAGFGVDPRVAFDFAWFRCPDSERINGTGGRPTCRDRRDAPDRLVFNTRSLYYRIDPNGVNGCTTVTGCPVGDAWRMTARNPTASPPTFTVAAREGDVFRRGQVLLAACPSGYRWTMATVDTAVSVGAAGDTVLTLHATDAAVPYFENAFTHDCFDTGATVFLIERNAFRIETIESVPWLVLDRGIDLDGDGNDPWTTIDPDDIVPIAPNVEDLQVAYVLERQPGVVAQDSNANFVTGDDAGSSALVEEPNAAAPAPEYQTALDHATRRNLHPANIRAIRLSLVTRSERGDPTRPQGNTGDVLPLLENSSRVLTAAERGRFRRMPFSSSVQLRNMPSRGMFVF